MNPGAYALLWLSIVAVFLDLKLDILDLRDRLDKLEGEVEAKERASHDRGNQMGWTDPE